MPAREDVDRINQAQTRLAARSGRAAAAGQGRVWCSYVGLTATVGWPKDATRGAVFSNLVALVLLGDAEDVVTLDSLIRAHGPERTAAIQAELDDLLGLGSDLPVTTMAIRVLGDVGALGERLADTGMSPAKVEATARRVHHQAFWLLLTGAEDLPRSRPIQTSAQLVDLLENGTARHWRAALLPMIESPWGPYGEHIGGLLREAALDEVATALQECRTVYQQRQEQRERDAIAREIRRLVAISGLTQREFAVRIGTSPSRLSTYVNGRVVPSAAMLLRMRRVAHAHHRAGEA